jgi:transposase
VLLRERKAKKHPGRQTLPAHLARVERVIACPSEQCRCGVCGQEKVIIGYEISEQLEVEPAQYFVQVTKREKRACSCGRDGVVTAPVAKRIIEKGLVSDRVVIQTLVNKYCSHLPLYRQSATLKQESGLELSRATMDGWVMQVGQMLMPVVGAMKKELLGGSYLQADETPVAVQMHDRRGHNHQAYLWQYSRPGGGVVFDFRLGRGREGPKQFLGKYGGILQTDGYVGYEKVGGPGLVHAGCWTHCRRGFATVAKLNPGDPVATPIVEKINVLFAIDAVACEQVSVDEVARMLQEKNRERAEALREFQGTRIYRMEYRGFPSDREAEMVVNMSYRFPDKKEFTIISQSGSNFIINHVFKKLLEGEEEAAGQENRRRTALSLENYDFQMLDYENAPPGARYLLEVTPKSKNKFLYRGKIWVDAQDFAVTQIEAEPAKNPSFWIKKTDIEHKYVKVANFWLPAENRSESLIRLGGRATLTIEYNDYKILAPRPVDRMMSGNATGASLNK